MKDKIADYWNWRSASYREEFDNYTKEEIIVWKKIFSGILPDKKPLRVIEFGTGPGIVGLALADMGHDVTGVDLSPEMIKRASANAKELGIKAEFKTGDAENPEPAETPYDLAISKYLMWTLPRPDKFLEGTRKLLGGGGRIVLIDGVWYSDTEEPVEKDRYLTWRFEEAYKEIKPLLPFGKNNTPEKVARFIQEHGFENSDWRYLDEYQTEYISKYGDATYNVTPYLITAMKI